MKKNTFLLIIISFFVMLLFICSLFITGFDKRIIAEDNISKFLSQKYKTEIHVLNHYIDSDNYVVMFYANSQICYAIFEKVFSHYYKLEGTGSGIKNNLGIDFVNKKVLVHDNNKRTLKILCGGVIHNSDIKKLLIKINDLTLNYDLNSTFLVYEELKLKANDHLIYEILFFDKNGNQLPYSGGSTSKTVLE